MRAVNLLPSDLRGTAPKAAPVVRQEKAQGIGAYVVLGALALCVAALAGYVITNNTLKQRTADLETAKTEAAAVAAQAAALKPYADFEAMANARVETVRGLAAARFDWERALRDLSLAAPSDVKLTSLNGDMGLPGASGGGDPLRGSIQAPAITLAGCASSQVGVARMMARVKAVDGVTRVALSKSEKAANAGTGASASPCAGKEPPTFSMVIFFEGSSAAAAITQDAAAQVPVPNAVNEAQPGTADGATAAPADGAPATETTTPTTTGGTP
jgi:Tfp pilus assembly protein PilN